MTRANPTHPGLSVLHDCIQPLGLTVAEAARRLGVSRKQLSALVNCRAGISPTMTIRLDKVFGGGADAWYRLQAIYNQSRTTDPEADPDSAPLPALLEFEPDLL